MTGAIADFLLIERLYTVCPLIPEPHPNHRERA